MMLSTYREIFKVPGSLCFSSAALIGRMPMSMTGIGIISMLSQMHGEYALAGAVAAAFALASAVLGPHVSRLVDIYGQVRVLPIAALFSAASLLALLLLARLESPPWMLFGCAILSGCMPSMSAMVRARWTQLLPQKSALQTAYAFESVLDEVSFIIGPPLSIGLSVAWFYEAGLLTALLLQILGVGIFVSDVKAEPKIDVPSIKHGQSPLKVAAVQRLVLLLIFMGMIVGTIDVVSVAFAEEQGVPAAASIVLSVYAIGSCLAGLIFGALKIDTSLSRSLVFCGVATALTTIPLVAVSSITGLSVVVFFSGLFFAPTMIVVMTLVEEIVPKSRIAEGFTWMISGLGVGIALGSGMSGQVVDAFGVRFGFVVALCAGFLSIILIAFSLYKIPLGETDE